MRYIRKRHTYAFGHVYMYIIVKYFPYYVPTRFSSPLIENNNEWTHPRDMMATCRYVVSTLGIYVRLVNGRKMQWNWAQGHSHSVSVPDPMASYVRWPFLARLPSFHHQFLYMSFYIYCIYVCMCCLCTFANWFIHSIQETRNDKNRKKKKCLLSSASGL